MKLLVLELVACCLIAWSSPTNSISVLLLNGMFPGHLFPLVSLGEELVSRGHTVSLCSTVLEGSSLLPSLPESVGVSFISAGYDMFSWSQYIETMKGMQHLSNFSLMNDVILSNEKAAIKIRKKLQSIGIEQFDIIVCDFSILPIGLYHAVLGWKVIVFSSFLPPFPAIRPSWPYPITFMGGQPEDMGFGGRMWSAVGTPLLLKRLAKLFKGAIEQDKEFSKVLSDVNLVGYPGVFVPHIVTSVIGIEAPTLLSPLRHYVGPVLRSSQSPLNDSLLDWLNRKQERSVLYISMGTTGDMSRSRAEMIVNAVLGTQYDAVWALRRDSMWTLDGLDIDSDRVIIRNWVSQQSLLQHRAIKACIVHCGLNSVQESLYNSLPVICLPSVFDQFQIGSAIEEREVGVSMYSFMDTVWGTNNFTLEDLVNAIRRITSNKYVANAQRLSKIYKFAGGARVAADLVEHYEDVGYDHLIPAFAKYRWSWVKYHNADVYALMLCVLTVFLWGCFKCCLCLGRCIQ